MSNLNAVSLFSGCGGLDVGLKRAGFRIITANDIDGHAVETYQKNIGGHIIHGDIRNKDVFQKIIKNVGNKHIDLMVGGPPCQGFSTLGSKLSSDPRNGLFKSYARIVSVINPDFILIENVMAMTTMYSGKFKDDVIDTFARLGYTVSYNVIDSVDYGVPQHRRRVFFFGSKSRQKFTIPKPTHGEDAINPYKTVGDAIMDLAGLENKIDNHVPLNHSEKVVARYKLIKEGGRLPSPEKLPAKIRRTNFGNSYKRLSRNKPSLTMVPGNNSFPIHPTRNRSLTAREAARIQTFPDNFVFVGDRRSQCIQVGNAVPPHLATLLCRHIKKFLKHTKIDGKSVKSHRPNILKYKSCQDMLQLGKISRKGDDAGFIDLFCGLGGFMVGMVRGGWKPLLSVDNNKYVEATHLHNFPACEFMSRDLSVEKNRREMAQLYAGREVGVITGGPPCQGFSIFGKRRFVNTRNYDPATDERNKLVFAYFDMVKRIKPRWFVMENVPGLASLDDGLVIKKLASKFKRIGYKNVESRILNAADYGAPQIRRRLLMIGTRHDYVIPWPKPKFFANPTDWQKPYSIVEHALSDLPPATNNSNTTVASHDLKISCHIAMNHKPNLVARYKLVSEGSKLDTDNMPSRLKKGYRTNNVKNYSHVYKRLDRNKPSNTIVPGHNAFPIHPWLNRSLTVREAARLQTIPDELRPIGPRQEQCIQVGNAFPPLVAETIANCIKKVEKNNWFIGSVPKSAFYSILDDAAAENLIIA